jgi:hypothetical protein
LPLKHGLSLDETALIIGRGRVWTSSVRNKYIKSGEVSVSKKPQTRNRSYFNMEEEAEILKPYIEAARGGGVLVVKDIHRAISSKLGKRISLATTYNILHRHNWRKLARIFRQMKKSRRSGKKTSRGSESSNRGLWRWEKDEINISR